MIGTALAASLVGVGILSGPALAQADQSRPAAVAAVFTKDGDAGHGLSSAFQPGTGQIVVDWNSELVAIERAAGIQPATVHPTRSYALLATAIYDSVTSITHAGVPYAFSVVAPHGADPVAAADQAAHDVLADLFPSITTTAPSGVTPLDQLLANELASVPAGPGKTSGEAIGARAASLIVALRAGDGSAATPPTFIPTSPPAPGGYQLTPPNNAAAVFTNWGSVTPWVLTSGSQFRPPPPPPLTSPEWAAAINQVQTLGVGQEQEQQPDPVTGDTDQPSTRVPTETTIANFWAPPIWNTWNVVTDGQITQHHLNLQQATHVLADVNLTLADGAIGFYDAKYTYNRWRPVTAIRAGTPNNSAVNPADPDWLPQPANGATAADPSYPAAHATESAAAAAVLTAFFGNEPVTVTTGAAGTSPRSFPNFAAAAAEAGQSRIFAGQHTSIDVNAGSALGAQIAGFVLAQPFGAGHADG
jgi:membrane-associated phospholipid phosphatase